ncbi:MAG: bestrophin family ion channel [Ferruginibacter sp.]
MNLPFGYSFTPGYYVIPVVAFIFYVLTSLELIAEDIEYPFGNDDNDVPTCKIALLYTSMLPNLFDFFTLTHSSFHPKTLRS